MAFDSIGSDPYYSPTLYLLIRPSFDSSSRMISREYHPVLKSSEVQCTMSKDGIFFVLKKLHPSLQHTHNHFHAAQQCPSQPYLCSLSLVLKIITAPYLTYRMGQSRDFQILSDWSLPLPFVFSTPLLLVSSMRSSSFVLLNPDMYLQPLTVIRVSRSPTNPPWFLETFPKRPENLSSVSGMHVSTRASKQVFKICRPPITFGNRFPHLFKFLWYPSHYKAKTKSTVVCSRLAFSVNVQKSQDLFWFPSLFQNIASQTSN